MGSIFNRNKFYLSALAIGLLVAGGLLFGLIVTIVAINLYLDHEYGYYKGEKKDGKPNGKGTLYFGKESSIEKIECDTFKDGQIDGVAKVFTRDGNNSKVEEYKFMRDYLLKDIKAKPNVAHFVINEAIEGPGDVAAKFGYQDKYGVFRTYALLNGKVSLDNFIKTIRRNDDIDVIKIGLLNHGGEKGNIYDTHGSDFRNILDRLCYEFKDTNKKIYIVNNACFGAENFENDPEYRSLKEIVCDISKKYGNKIVLAQHKDKDTPHMVLPTYDNKTKHYGVKHFHLKYCLIDCGKETKKLSKEEKNNILYWR